MEIFNENRGDLTDYHYLLFAVFDRPRNEVRRVKTPTKNFMQFKIFRDGVMTEIQFDNLYDILNSDRYEHLDMEKRYRIFHRTIIFYNDIEKVKSRREVIEKLKERRKTPEYKEEKKEYFRKYRQTEKYKEYNKKRNARRRKGGI
jgi:hypothetical protein|tara:strand:- start:260 stop:694 length:435 start_codon:yes stop_codon:yes gene_type:complete